MVFWPFLDSLSRIFAVYALSGQLWLNFQRPRWRRNRWTRSSRNNKCPIHEQPLELHPASRGRFFALPFFTFKNLHYSLLIKKFEKKKIVTWQMDCDRESSWDRSRHDTCIADRFCNLPTAPEFVDKSDGSPDTTSLCNFSATRGS